MLVINLTDIYFLETPWQNERLHLIKWSLRSSRTNLCGTNCDKVQMSSDESGVESGDEHIFINHPLPWRSSKVEKFFTTLDEAAYQGKSPQAKRQMKKRCMGEISSREKPDNIPK